MTFSPAACDTLVKFFKDTKTDPTDYNVIYTGDLGSVGTQLLYDLVGEEGYDLRCRHADCGSLIFDGDKQDTHADGFSIRKCLINSFNAKKDSCFLHMSWCLLIDDSML